MLPEMSSRNRMLEILNLSTLFSKKKITSKNNCTFNFWLVPLNSGKISPQGTKIRRIKRNWKRRKTKIKIRNKALRKIKKNKGIGSPEESKANKDGRHR